MSSRRCNTPWDVPARSEQNQSDYRRHYDGASLSISGHSDQRRREQSAGHKLCGNDKGGRSHRSACVFLSGSLAQTARFFPRRSVSLVVGIVHVTHVNNYRSLKTKIHWHSPSVAACQQVIKLDEPFRVNVSGVPRERRAVWELAWLIQLARCCQLAPQKRLLCELSAFSFVAMICCAENDHWEGIPSSQIFLNTLRTVSHV